jgi:cytoskeletal protein RodZ
MKRRIALFPLAALLVGAPLARVRAEDAPASEEQPQEQPQEQPAEGQNNDSGGRGGDAQEAAPTPAAEEPSGTASSNVEAPPKDEAPPREDSGPKDEAMQGEGGNAKSDEVKTDEKPAVSIKVEATEKPAKAAVSIAARKPKKRSAKAKGVRFAAIKKVKTPAPPVKAAIPPPPPPPPPPIRAGDSRRAVESLTGF